MNEKKICFIMCVNDELYENESLKYLHHLHVPEGYEMEQLSVREAASIAEGYQFAMKQSDAKYKVYLHQDVFLINQNLIEDILRIFEDESIGMIGLVGSPKLPADGVMWNSKRIGKIFTSNILEAGESIAEPMKEPYEIVEAVDGLCMITQYDIPWRADLFYGWDFYDISQAMEFQKRGYQVIVPYMEQPWCIHDDGDMNLEQYFYWRDVFLKEYSSFLKLKGGNRWKENRNG